MTTTTFVDGTTVIRASWLNDVNTTSYTTVPALAAANTGTNTGDQLTFKTIAISGQANVVADTITDTLTLVAGSGVTLTTDATTDTITIAASGGILTKYVQTADQTITAAGALTIAHGLGVTPTMVLPFIRCTSAQANYIVGDVTPVLYNLPNNRGVAITMDSTNIYVRYGAGAATIGLLDKTSGVEGSTTNTNWSFFVRAWA